MRSGMPTYTVLTIESPPFVYYDEESDRYSGMLIDLLKEIARRLRFKYVIDRQATDEYGYMEENGTWNGLIADLMRGQADIGLAAFGLMSERMRVVDMTEPFFGPSGISVVMQKPAVQTSFFRFLTVLEADVWFCIIGAYLFTSFLLWIFDAWSPYSGRNKRKRQGNRSGIRVFTIKESLWFCLTSLTPQGGGDAPKNLSGRLIAATWWLFGFIIIASYTANLAAFLTITKFDKNIDSFEDLISQYRYTFGVVENTSVYRYFKRMSDIENTCYELWKKMTLNSSLTPYQRSQFAVWDYPLSDKYIKIFSTISQRLIKNTSQAYALVSNPDSKFALIAETTEVKYQVMINCELKEIGPEFSKKPFVLALPKNSELTSKINNVIISLNQENWMLKIQNKWWKDNPYIQRCDDLTNSQGIIFQNIGGVFFLIGIGIAAAFVTLTLEFFYYRYLRKSFVKLSKIYNTKLDAFIVMRKKKVLEQRRTHQKFNPNTFKVIQCTDIQ